jgi:hypothetical protein
MARERTKDEILDQLVYAVNCVARHYGPGLSAEGLKDIRDKFAEDNWWCDSTWRVDTEDEPNPDFCPFIIEDGYMGLNFAEVARESREG